MYDCAEMIGMSRQEHIFEHRINIDMIFIFTSKKTKAPLVTKKLHINVHC